MQQESLCAVQAEQGAAAQAVDAFQVGVQVAESALNGVSYSKNWANWKTGWLGCFFPTRIVIINFP